MQLTIHLQLVSSLKRGATPLHPTQPFVACRNNCSTFCTAEQFNCANLCCAVCHNFCYSYSQSVATFSTLIASSI